MEILPLKSIRDEDSLIIGKEILALAKLYQAGLPVPDGIVVCPPEFKLKTILEYYDFSTKEIFEQRLEIIKKDILNIPISEELVNILDKKKINPQATWQNLLNFWLDQIRSKVWREGFAKGITLNLSAHPIFFISKIKASGKVYYDFDLKQNIETVESGELDPYQIVALEQITKKANKLLFLPHVYDFIDDGKIHIIKVRPFTQYPKININLKEVSKKEQFKTVKVKSVIKVFLDVSNSLKTSENIDGYFIKGEEIKDHEEAIWHLVEVSSNNPNLPVIFKLADKFDDFGGLRGSLRLIHDKNLLKDQVTIFLFARHKKQLLNTQIAIPFVRSVDEFLHLKRDLAVLGISRKGSMKLWIEFCIPENIINLDDYIAAGFDGAIINLDQILAWLGGFNPEHEENSFYKKQTSKLSKFLVEGLKKLHKNQIPFIVTGDISLNDEVLKFLIEAGVSSVVVNYPQSQGVNEYIHLVEKMTFRSRH